MELTRRNGGNEESEVVEMTSFVFNQWLRRLAGPVCAKWHLGEPVCAKWHLGRRKACSEYIDRPEMDGSRKHRKVVLKLRKKTGKPGTSEWTQKMKIF